MNANSLVGAPSDGYAVAVEDGEVGCLEAVEESWESPVQVPLGNRQRPRNSPLVGYSPGYLRGPHNNLLLVGGGFIFVFHFHPLF